MRSLSGEHHSWVVVEDMASTYNIQQLAWALLSLLARSTVQLLPRVRTVFGCHHGFDGTDLSTGHSIMHSRRRHRIEANYARWEVQPRQNNLAAPWVAALSSLDLMPVDSRLMRFSKAT